MNDNLYNNPSDYNTVAYQIISLHKQDKKLFNHTLDICNEILVYNTFQILIKHNEYDVIEDILKKFDNILNLNFEYDYDQFMFPNHVVMVLLEKKYQSVFGHIINKYEYNRRVEAENADKLLSLFLDYGLNINDNKTYFFVKYDMLPIHYYMGCAKYSVGIVNWLLNNGAILNIESNYQYYMTDKWVYCDAIAASKLCLNKEIKELIDNFVYESKLSMMLGIKIGDINLSKNKRRRMYFDYNLVNEILRYYVAS